MKDFLITRCNNCMQVYLDHKYTDESLIEKFYISELPYGESGIGYCPTCESSEYLMDLNKTE